MPPENPENNNGVKRVCFLGAVIVYFFCVISVISHIPGHQIAKLQWNVWDKAAHFAIYFPLGILLGLGLKKMSKWVVLGIFSVFLFGLLDEYHQSFIPGRFSSLGDVVADFAGGVAGLATGLVMKKLTGGSVEPSKEFKSEE